MSEPSSTPAPGRRVAAAVSRGADATVVLAVLLVLLTVGALLLVRPGSQEVATQPPERAALTRATIVCPGGAPASLSTTTDASGPVAVRMGKDEAETTADLAPRTITTVPGDGPVVAVGEDALAPGLVGGVSLSPLAAAPCRQPATDQWFTGVGAGARHSSLLELVNPDAGPAVVDATLVGQDGVVDAPELRGVAVPAHGIVRIDLATTVPRRDELSLRVTTSRGRVSATVRDRYDQLGAGAAARDWLPGQAAPATTNLMLGLVSGSGQRNLVLNNPGPDETRAARPGGHQGLDVHPEGGQGHRRRPRGGDPGIDVEAAAEGRPQRRDRAGRDLARAAHHDRPHLRRRRPEPQRAQRAGELVGPRHPDRQEADRALRRHHGWHGHDRRDATSPATGSRSVESTSSPTVASPSRCPTRQRWSRSPRAAPR